MQINLPCTEKEIQQTNQFAIALLLVLFTMACIATLAYVGISKTTTTMAFFTKERYVYMGCLLLLLPLCFICMQISIKTLATLQTTRIPIMLSLLFLWLLFWLAAIPALMNFWLLVLYGQPTLYAPFKHPLLMLNLFVFSAFVVCLVALPNLIRKINAEPTRIQYFFWCVALLFASLLVGSQNITGLAAVATDAPRWDANFEPVIYPLSQVLAGKTLLVDLPSQYGLYPELMAPLFKWVGFSVSGVTFLFGLMEAASYLALTIVFLKLTKSLVFRLFWAISAAVLFAFAFQNYPSNMYFDPYYQYYPIRLFFPAISVFLFWQFIAVPPRMRNAFAFAIFLAIGVIWNLDSGIPAMGSFFTYLILSAFFAKKTARMALIKIFLLAIVGAAITFLLFATYLTMKAGVSIPWDVWLRYQRIFYIFGYGAIPLPVTPHPWMAVIAIYSIGILGYMRAQSQQSPALFWKLMLYLSVLGLGLFAYYQHRSHDAVFLAAFWPALFIGYACAERFLRYIISARLPTSWILAVLPSFIFGVLFCGFFAYKIPTFIGQAKYNWMMAFSKKVTPVMENITFMHERISNNDRESVAIIAWLQAIYFAELGIPSAVKGQGVGGAMPGEDQIALLKRLGESNPRIIFLQRDIMPLVEAALRKEYLFVDENQHNILHFRARN